MSLYIFYLILFSSNFCCQEQEVRLLLEKEGVMVLKKLCKMIRATHVMKEVRQLLGIQSY